MTENNKYLHVEAEVHVYIRTWKKPQEKFEEPWLLYLFDSTPQRLIISETIFVRRLFEGGIHSRATFILFDKYQYR